jgi:hypothetical protein
MACSDHYERKEGRNKKALSMGNGIIHRVKTEEIRLIIVGSNIDANF